MFDESFVAARMVCTEAAIGRMPQLERSIPNDIARSMLMAERLLVCPCDTKNSIRRNSLIQVFVTLKNKNKTKLLTTHANSEIGSTNWLCIEKLRGNI